MRKLQLGLLLLAASLCAATGCGDDDRLDPSSSEGGDASSVEAGADASASIDAMLEARADPDSGAVATPPDGSTEVDAAISEPASGSDGGPASGSDGGPASGSDGGPAPGRDGSSPLGACSFIEPRGDVLVDLGHDSAATLQLAGDRLLSRSQNRWVLWQLSTGTRLADAEVPGFSAGAPATPIGGSVFVVASATAREVRNLSDGRLLGTIPVGSGMYGVARDGSYVWTSDVMGLTVWSPSGALVVTFDGNYANAKVLATADTLYVATTTVELLAVPAGTRTTREQLGTFGGWFLDGSRGWTTSGSTVRIYGADGVQQRIISIGAGEKVSGGSGKYFWTTAGNQLSFYGLEAATAPVLTVSLGTFGTTVASPSVVAHWADGGQSLEMIELAESGLVVRRASVPSGYLTQFAATDASTWLVSDRNGGIFGEVAGTGRSFGCGRALDIALSESGRWAVAVDANQILLGTTQDRALSQLLAFRANQLELSGDGSILAARADDSSGYLADRTLRVYDAPSGSLRWSAESSGDTPPFIVSFTMSASGERLARALCSRSAQDWPCSYVFSSGSGAADPLTLSSSHASFSRLVMSRSGMRVALAKAEDKSVVSNFDIYDGSTLVGNASGTPAVWLGEDRVLVNTYKVGRNGYVFEASAIVDAQGAVVARPTLPELFDADVIAGSERVYLRSGFDRNVYDVSTGQVVWKRPDGDDKHARLSSTHALYTQNGVVKLTTHP